MITKEQIARLNEIIKDPKVSEDVKKLLETRIPVCEPTATHPSIQVANHLGTPTMGFLGLLNGIVGVLPEGNSKAGWGYIAAHYDDNNNLVKFDVLENK